MGRDTKNIEQVKKILNILTKEQKDKNGSTMLGNFQEAKLSDFKILIATILSARAKDETTIPISEELFKHYKDAKELANADPNKVKEIIKSIGFYNNKTDMIIKAAKYILKNNNIVPDDMDKLLEIPGVGRKVAGCVLVYAHQKDAIPVDTHVHRISNRLGWVATTQPEKTEQELMKLVPKEYWQKVNDSLVWHGKTVCNPITPICSKCIINKLCPKIGVIKQK